MNNKTTAILAVVAMVMAGMVISISTSADAEGEIELGKVLVEEGGDSDSVLLKFNESAYAVNQSYEVRMYAGTSGGSENVLFLTKNVEPDTNSGNLDIGSGSLTLSAKQRMEGDSPLSGNYDVNVRAASGTTAGSYSIFIKVEVSVTVADGVQITPDVSYYKMTVNVTDNPADITFNNIEVVSGQDGKHYLTANSQSSFDYDAYSWYAIGLPDGMSVGADTTGLYVAGLANYDASGSDEYTVDVMGRDSIGSEVRGSFTLTVTESKELAYNLTYGAASDTDSDGLFDNILNRAEDGDVWVAKTDSDPGVVLNVYNFTPSSVTVVKVDDGDISRVYGTETSPGSGSYNIPTDGAGVYTIEIGYDGGVKEVKLFVIPATSGAGAGFVVIGGA